jgi:hypothetical protein
MTVIGKYMDIVRHVLSVAVAVVWSGRLWHGEWQWQGGSGTVGKRRSGRFEWWWLERGSGNIGRDMDG